jgi:hypothetical protein
MTADIKDRWTGKEPGHVGTVQTTSLPGESSPARCGCGQVIEVLYEHLWLVWEHREQRCVECRGEEMPVPSAEQVEVWREEKKAAAAERWAAHINRKAA